MKIYDYKGRKNISGNRIREARLKKRLSQADFAAKLQIAGITMERDSVSRIEIGTRFVADYELMYKDLDKVEKYLELHIEQGGVLESMKKDIGVVSSIVGEERYMVTVHGRENHAGTTPMKYRDDALIKASKMMLSLNEKCKEIDDTMVVTVGWIKAFPGEQNIIPGKVQMTVEIRSVHEQSIRKLVDHMRELCVQYDCDFELTLTQNPTVMSRLCMEAIHESAEELGLSDMVMQSGAGHDAMMIANVIRDTGMIFAPSKGGVSHCPQEWTEWSDVENSVNVLLHTILKLDKK